MKQIITSLLETDLYKFSMGQAIFHQFPSYKTTWTFKCRNKDVFFTPEMVEEIRSQIRAYCQLSFTEDELNYLRQIGARKDADGFILKKGWIKDSYVDFLRLWHPRFEEFEITTEGEKGLTIEAHGTWLNTSMYEIPTLAIVNEVFFNYAYSYDELREQFKRKLNEKVSRLVAGEYQLGAFSEFGIRRRLSAECQELAVKSLKEAKLNDQSIFVGTSNVFLAKKYNLLPVGTMAHEWIMCVGQGNRAINPAYSNLYALRAWVNEYKVQNGTALTDAVTTDCFLRDFDEEFATVFSGVRHDSGDPLVWGDKMIAHYQRLGIDPKSKTLLFSDSLNFEKATKIKNYFEGRAKTAFGIGTYIANDTDVPPLNIVMKTTLCNDGDVAKISDTPGKGMCKNPDYVDYLQRAIDWRMTHPEMNTTILPPLQKVLAIVDAQNDFIDGSLGVGQEKWGKAKAAILKLIEEEKYDKVIFTKDWHPANHCSFKEQGGLWPAHCVQNEKGADVDDELKRLNVPTEVLLKGTQTGVEEYGVDVLMNQGRVKELHLVGLCFDYCVSSCAKKTAKRHPNTKVIIKKAGTVAIDDSAIITFEEKNVVVD